LKALGCELGGAARRGLAATFKRGSNWAFPFSFFIFFYFMELKMTRRGKHAGI
jgi:hypothetical protein